MELKLKNLKNLTRVYSEASFWSAIFVGTRPPIGYSPNVDFN